MPWEDRSRADRKAEDDFYGDPVYLRNKAIVKRRAAGRCEKCHHRHRTQCDHVIPRSRGGGHAVSNLQMLCHGEGTCKCHEAKTAAEGGGFRLGHTKIKRDPRPRPRTTW